MRGQRTAFGSLPVTRDEQRVFFAASRVFFPYICVFSRACLLEPALPGF